MKPSFPLFAVCLVAFSYAALANHKPNTKPKAEINFGRDVKPIIIQHCFKCHGPDAAKAAAGLRLDSFEGATKQLGDGAAIVPGDPHKSVLIQRVSEKDASMRMPPSDSNLKALT